ncbi:MAG: toprim domain-containing protein, partial [Mucinivorans sp.]
IVSKLSKYREILILLDNDKGGHTATEKLIGILTLENGLTNVNLHPIGAYLIDSNYNDVNEYLVNLGM